jgi:hypothetical protein
MQECISEQTKVKILDVLVEAADGSGKFAEVFELIQKIPLCAKPEPVIGHSAAYSPSREMAARQIAHAHRWGQDWSKGYGNR